MTDGRGGGGGRGRDRPAWGRLRARLVERSRRDENRIAALAFLAVAVAAFRPTLGGGFLLQLDAVFAPDASHLRFALDSKGPLYYGRLPFVALLDAAALALPAWTIQRAVFLGAVAGAGYAGYAAATTALDAGTAGDDGGRFEARLFAGLLYAVNPFVYVRLLAGQWYFVLGYAVLPLAVVAFHAYVAGERDRPTRALAWVTLVAVFDPHAAVLAALAGGTTLLATLPTAGRRALARAGRFCALAVGANAYWLLPAATALLAGGSQLSTVGTADLVAYSPRGSVLGDVPLSVSMLYGFWRGGYLYPFDVVPLWAVFGCFLALVTVAVYGLIDDGDPLAYGLAGCAVAGGVLGVGVAVPAVAPLFRALAAMPVGAGMREAGKFVALLALAYALLGARGVDRLRADVDAVLADRGTAPGRARPVVALFVVLVLSVPLAYTVPMVAGFSGGFQPTEYPDDWHAVDDRLDRDDGEYRVLYLPWHQYLRYDWAGGTVASPAPLFFGPEVVASRDPDLGVGSQATDPTHRRLGELLESPPEAGFGRRVAPLGVKYVVLSRTADHERYGYLYEQSDLAVVYRGEQLVVFENRAFDGSDPGSWPPAGPAVPWRSLAAGAAVSAATVAALGRLGDGWR
ncbi:hypothetical protein BRC97_05575 [Halobacteriales archaeon QS_6_71_20]|nr:MAG: hypothetical protein BRC97_05575 [Halobacteriales archaeon QS_6_71_20]